MDLFNFVLIIIILFFLSLVKPAYKWLTLRRILTLDPKRYKLTLSDVVAVILKERIYEKFYELLNERKSVNDLFYELGSIFKDVFGADGFAVITTPRNKEWKFIAWDLRYDKSDLIDLAMRLQKMDNSNIKQVIIEKSVLPINNTERYKYWLFKKTTPVKSWLGIPIIDNDNVIAIISADWFEKNRIEKWMVEASNKIMNLLGSLISSFEEIIRTLEEPEIDPLLGIPNVNAMKNLFNKLSQIGQVGLLYVEVTNLKRFEKIFGYSSAVKILREVYQRIKSAIGERGKIFQYTPESFVILFDNLVPGLLLSYERKIYHAFFRVINTTHAHKSIVVKVDVDVKEAVFPKDGKDLDTLLKKVTGHVKQ